MSASLFSSSAISVSSDPMSPSSASIRWLAAWISSVSTPSFALASSISSRRPDMRRLRSSMRLPERRGHAEHDDRGCERKN